jgi:hypothetical protein
MKWRCAPLTGRNIVVKVAAFSDSRGNLHASAKQAAISDLAQVFGNSEGMATGIAGTVLAKRAEIQAIFAELDEMEK